MVICVKVSLKLKDNLWSINGNLCKSLPRHFPILPAPPLPHYLCTHSFIDIMPHPLFTLPDFFSKTVPLPIPDPLSPIYPKKRQEQQEQNKKNKKSCNSCQVLSLLSKKNLNCPTSRSRSPITFLYFSQKLSHVPFPISDHVPRFFTKNCPTIKVLMSKKMPIFVT